MKDFANIKITTKKDTTKLEILVFEIVTIIGILALVIRLIS